VVADPVNDKIRHVSVVCIAIASFYREVIPDLGHQKFTIDERFVPAVVCSLTCFPSFRLQGPWNWFDDCVEVRFEEERDPTIVENNGLETSHEGSTHDTLTSPGKWRHSRGGAKNGRTESLNLDVSRDGEWTCTSRPSRSPTLAPRCQVYAQRSSQDGRLTFTNVTYNTTWDRISIDPNPFRISMLSRQIRIALGTLSRLAQEDLERRRCWIGVEKSMMRRESAVTQSLAMNLAVRETAIVPRGSSETPEWGKYIGTHLCAPHEIPSWSFGRGGYPSDIYVSKNRPNIWLPVAYRLPSWPRNCRSPAQATGLALVCSIRALLPCYMPED